jgi:hypothetical protein
MKIRERYGILSLILSLFGLALTIFVVPYGVSLRILIPCLLLALTAIIFGSLSLRKGRHKIISIIGISASIWIIGQTVLYVLASFAFIGRVEW